MSVPAPLSPLRCSFSDRLCSRAGSTRCATLRGSVRRWHSPPEKPMQLSPRHLLALVAIAALILVASVGAPNSGRIFASMQRPSPALGGGGPNFDPPVSSTTIDLKDVPPNQARPRPVK